MRPPIRASGSVADVGRDHETEYATLRDLIRDRFGIFYDDSKQFLLQSRRGGADDRVRFRSEKRAETLSRLDCSAHIPRELYAVVAEVLAYVYRGRSGAGSLRSLAALPLGSAEAEGRSA